MNKFLSYGKQSINEDDISSVIEVLKSDFLTQGPKVAEFEKQICNYTGSKYAVAVANGTAALHIAVAALDIKENCEGITSPISFVASANCMAYNNIKPIFADIDRKTYNISTEEIKKRINHKTKLIIPVHFAGQSAAIEEINKISRENNLKIIEDAAHAIGSNYYDGSKVGNCKYSDLTCFSFHPVKTITTCEGGAITTNNIDIYNKLLLLRNHGITKDTKKFTKDVGPWYHEMKVLGYNYRLTDIQAALGISQIKKIEHFKKRRREIVKSYNEAFKNIECIEIPYEAQNLDSCFHLYIIKIDFKKTGMTRTDVINKLKMKNIGTQVHYIPIYLQPYYQERYNYKSGECPNAEEYYEKALSIPLYPKMTDDDMNYVIENIKEILK